MGNSQHSWSSLGRSSSSEYERRSRLAKGEVLRRLLADTMTEKKLNLEDYAKVTELITKTPPTTQRAESFSASMQDLL